MGRPGSFFFVLLFLSLANQTAAALQTDKCTIEGVVLASTSGAPLSGVLITIRSKDDSSSPSLVVITDAGGHYAVDGLQPGGYVIVAQRRGYIRQAYGQQKRNHEGTTLILGQGMKLHDIDFRLIPAGVITGRVFDEDREPIVGATVQALTSEYVQGERRLIGGATPVNTNDLGEYRIYGLAPDHYYVGVSGQASGETRAVRPKGTPAEKLYLPTLYPNAPDLDQATAIDLDQGGELRGVDIVALTSSTFHIRGRIVGFGPTYQYTRAQLESVGVGWEANRGGADIAPDAQGNFDFGGVTPGRYILSVILTQKGSFASAARSVRVEHADVDDVVLEPSIASETRGRVRVQGSEGIDFRKVGVELSAPYSPPRFGIMSSDGSFVFQNLGHYVYKIGVSGLPADFYVKSIRLGDQDLDDRTIDLSSIEQPAGVLEIVVSGTGGRLEGIVTNDKGAPSRGSMVVLIPDSSHRRESDLFKDAIADQDGRFVIRGVTPGDYKLFAWDDIKPGAWWDQEFLSRYEVRGEKVKIVENGHLSSSLELISVSPK